MRRRRRRQLRLQTMPASQRVRGSVCTTRSMYAPCRTDPLSRARAPSVVPELQSVRSASNRHQLLHETAADRRRRLSWSFSGVNSPPAVNQRILRSSCLHAHSPLDLAEALRSATSRFKSTCDYGSSVGSVSYSGALCRANLSSATPRPTSPGIF